jgi:tetratricopeptide (TPR) repeat protein
MPAVVSSAFGSGDAAKRYQDAEAAPTPRIAARTHVAAGRMLERQGDLEGAIGQYERAIAANPRFVGAYNRLGILHYKLGRGEDAEKILEQGIRINPRAVILRNNLGYCCLEQRRFEEAEEQFRQVLNISPEFKRARMNLAVCLGQRGRAAESLAEFSRVVAMDVAHYNLAVICVSRQDYAGAERALRQALAINPQCPGADVQLEQVVALQRASETRGPDRALAEAMIKSAEGNEPASEPGVVIPLAGSADREGVDTP